jgi:hypothetical protein
MQAPTTDFQIEEQERLWFSDDPPALHPDLVKDMCETKWFSVVSNKLIHEALLPHPDGVRFRNAAGINMNYLSLVEGLAAAERANDHSTFVVNHRGPYQLEALLICEERGFTDHREFWELVGQVWPLNETIARSKTKWRKVWTRPYPGREHVMDEEDRAHFARLPAEFRVYRGVPNRRSVQGLSWTTDREMAIWFAHRNSKRMPPLLATGLTRKSDVLAFFTARNEIRDRDHS